MTDDIKCPVCREHEDETLGSYGIVFSGARAILEGDWDKVRDLATTLTPYDAHVAITWFGLVMIDLCKAVGGDPIATLNYYQAALNESFAQDVTE